MKVNNTRVIIAVAALIIIIVVFNKLGFDITAILNLAIPAIPIVLVGYLLILVKRYVDAKVQESNASTNMNALKESLDRIEKKLDKIDKILEKVSE